MSLFRCTAVAMFGLVLSAFASSVLDAAPVVGDPLKVEDCTFGNVYQFSSAGCTATLKNNGTVPLVLSITPVQPGNTAEPDKLTLQPQAEAQVLTHVRTDNIGGEIGWTFRIEGVGQSPHFVKARGFVMSVFDTAHPSIAFGSIGPTQESVTKSVALASNLYPNARITKILSSAEFLHAKIGGDARTLTTEIGSDAPWGQFDEMVKLAVDAPVQQEVWVQVTGSIEGDIGPKKNPYWLGTVPWQEKRTLTVPLIDRQGHDFKIGKVTSKDFAATYDSAVCEPAQAGCRNLLIHVADSQGPGFFKNEFSVELPDRNKHLKLVLWGVLGARSQPGEPPVAPALTKVPLPDPKAESETPPPPMKVQPEPPGEGPLLKWTIAHQGNVHGYQVFRGDSPDGPFALMDPRLISVLDNGTGPVKYQWRDTSATKGQTYWYYIAVVYKSGDRSALSGPQKTVAK